MQLVFIEDQQEPFTLSSVIAEYGQVSHETVQSLIRKREKDLEEFGIIGFEIRKLNEGAGRPKKVYHLNEQQATLLITFMRNTAPVIQFKKALVKAFYDMRMELEYKKPEHPNMGANLLRTFGKQYGSLMELIEDTQSLQIHDDPFQLPDLMHDRNVALIIKMLDYYRFPLMPSFREIRTMIHFIKLYHLREFVKKLVYCFENNKLSIPYLMVSLENNTTTVNKDFLEQQALLEKYIN